MFLILVGTATSGIVIRRGGVSVTVIKYCETCNSTARVFFAK